ncbi:hypothetical protein TWF281_006283 [Arthrobotrys megalospora]
MSAADARKLLAASRKSRRITSPYASYSLAGALFCNICSNTPIKSESLWDAHVASAQHKSNVARRGGTVSSGKSSNKRPAEASSSGDSRNGTTDGPAASKRLKTAKADVKNLALPVGFFDDDDDEDEEGIISTGEVIEPDDDENPTVAAVEGTNQQPPQPASTSSSSKLPADFFSTTSTSSKPKETDLDDEWAAFQADIAEEEKEEPTGQSNPTANHTISAPALTAAQIQQQDDQTTSSMNARNARTIAEEEMEDARAAMAEFFDEQSSLEERVARLKERREMLRQTGVTAPASMPPPPPQTIHRSNSVRSVTMGGMDDSNPVPELQSEGSDDDYEDDDEMFLRRR